MEKTFILRKLVRDKIPSLVAEEGRKMKPIETSSTAELHGYYKAKLVEEATEIYNATSPADIKEEIADLLEVIYAYCQKAQLNLEEIDQIRKTKKAKKGGFDEGHIIDTVTFGPDSAILAKFYNYYLENADRYPIAEDE